MTRTIGQTRCHVIDHVREGISGPKTQVVQRLSHQRERFLVRTVDEGGILQGDDLGSGIPDHNAVSCRCTPLCSSIRQH